MGQGSLPVIFDEKSEGICIAFYPERPKGRGARGLLWWVLPPTLETMVEVARFVKIEQLPVKAIVIGGLDAYPIGESRWPKWLARLSQMCGPVRIVVDTAGLNQRQRSRLIAGTRREYEMSQKYDPVQTLWAAVKYWAQGRVR